MTGDTQADEMSNAMKDAGAHEDCIAFVKEYPESNATAHVRSCYEYDQMESAGRTGGGFFGELWNEGATAAEKMADKENTRRLKRLN